MTTQQGRWPWLRFFSDIRYLVESAWAQMRQGPRNAGLGGCGIEGVSRGWSGDGVSRPPLVIIGGGTTKLIHRQQLVCDGEPGRLSPR